MREPILCCSLFLLSTATWRLTSAFSGIEELEPLLARPPHPMLFCEPDATSSLFAREKKGAKSHVEEWQNKYGDASLERADEFHINQSIRAVQYNVWNFDDGPDWNETRWGIIREILLAQRKVDEQTPNIIALNEIRISENQSMFSTICDDLTLQGYLGVFAPAMVYPDGKVEGIALFSKFGFSSQIETRNLHFESAHHPSDLNRRVILGAHICFTSARRGCVNIFASHFSYDAKQRAENAVSALAFISSFVKKRPQPMMFLADFNSQEEDDSVTNFLQLTLGLKDAADSHVESASQNTYCNCGHEPCDLNRRPDRVLVSAELQVLDAKTGPRGSVRGVCPSDHRPVFCEVELQQ